MFDFIYYYLCGERNCRIFSSNRIIIIGVDVDVSGFWQWTVSTSEHTAFLRLSLIRLSINTASGDLVQGSIWKLFSVLRWYLSLGSLKISNWGIMCPWLSRLEKKVKKKTKPKNQEVMEDLIWLALMGSNHFYSSK